MIDDNLNKQWGRLTEGVPIVGGRDSIMAIVEKYNIDQILFAIPTARVEDRRDILNICKEQNVNSRLCRGSIPAGNGQVSLSKMKKQQSKICLEEIDQVNMEEIFQYIIVKTIPCTSERWLYWK